MGSEGVVVNATGLKSRVSKTRCCVYSLVTIKVLNERNRLLSTVTVVIVLRPYVSVSNGVCVHWFLQSCPLQQFHT